MYVCMYVYLQHSMHTETKRNDPLTNQLKTPVKKGKSAFKIPCPCRRKCDSTEIKSNLIVDYDVWTQFWKIEYSRCLLQLLPINITRLKTAPKVTKDKKSSSLLKLHILI